MKFTVALLADQDKGYTAVVPALPGCVSEGDTVEEALDMVAEAVSLYLESGQEHGEEIPLELPGTLAGEVDVDASTYQTHGVKGSIQS